MSRLHHYLFPHFHDDDEDDHHHLDVHRLRLEEQRAVAALVVRPTRLRLAGDGAHGQPSLPSLSLSVPPPVGVPSRVVVVGAAVMVVAAVV